MKDITTYCEKTIESTYESIKNTEITFINLTENHEFLSIHKILKTNIEANKRQLQQRKFKKLNYLKYKPQPMKDQISATTQANFQKSYENAVKETTNINNPKIHHLKILHKTKPSETNT